MANQGPHTHLVPVQPYGVRAWNYSLQSPKLTHPLVLLARPLGFLLFLLPTLVSMEMGGYIHPSLRSFRHLGAHRPLSVPRVAFQPIDPPPTFSLTRPSIHPASQELRPCISPKTRWEHGHLPFAISICYLTFFWQLHAHLE